MFEIREMTQADLTQVAALAASLFTQPWNKQGFAEALPMDNTCFLIAEKEGMILGYCGLYMALDEGEIINIAVRADSQQQGIADQLLKAVLKEGKRNGVERFFLEVRVSNIGAIRLYEKNGFHKQGVRKNFYRSPCEDAYVMNRMDEIK